MEEKKYILEGQEYSHEDLAILSVARACEKKANKPLIMDLRHLNGAFTEYFVIMSVENARQAYAIADDVRLYFKNVFDLRPVAMDGLETCTWILLDFGFMFVHVFQEPTRSLYQLEQLWGKARQVATDDTILDALYKPTKEFLAKINSSLEIDQRASYT